MNGMLRIFLFVTGLIFSASVFTLLFKKKINERHSLIWLGGVIAILILFSNPEWFDVIATRFGVHYPPSLFFLLSILILAFILLYQSIQISILYDKVKELAQFVALKSTEKGERPDRTEALFQEEGR